MDKNQWILTGILIIIVAVVAFNFNSWTGTAIKTMENTILPLESKISVTPTSVKAGEEIEVTIKPARDPKICVDSTIGFYQLKDDGTLGLRTATRDISNSLGTRKNCDTVVIVGYKTQTNWKGNYVAVVEDRETGNKIQSNVFVIN